MTADELRALADALSGERIAGMLDAEEAQVCEDAAGYLRAQADEKPMAWITEESAQRLLGGGNDSRGTVPAHYAKSRDSKIALYTHPAPATPQAEPTEAQIVAVAEVLLAWEAEISNRVSARVLAEDAIRAALAAKDEK